MRRSLFVLCIVLAALTVGFAHAQTNSPRTVTADEVNAIARTLYCPVCENITLDTCGTAACDDWRYEIRLQLEAGYTPQQIKDDFVRRFGDRVVGTPQDPTLRALSLVTPYVLVMVGLMLLLRLYAGGRSKPQRHVLDALPARPAVTDDELRARIERDTRS
jgi:cytochrome c-type biogenesis protein CcmH